MTMQSEPIRLALVRDGWTVLRRHGVEYHVGQGEDGEAWYAWTVPIDDTTTASKRFHEESDGEDYTELAEEIAEWVDEPEPWRSRLARLLARLTGGRPMIDEGEAFTDVVSGESVLHFRDRFGRDWLATGRWATFRVPRRGPGFNLDERLWGWKRDR